MTMKLNEFLGELSSELSESKTGMLNEKMDDIFEEVALKLVDYAWTKVFLDEGEFPVVMRFDTPDEGKAIAALLMAISNRQSLSSMGSLYQTYFKGSNPPVNVKSNGPWCFWEEDEITFFSNIKDALKAWARWEEEDGAEELLNSASVKSLESKAEKAIKSKKPFKSISGIAG